jgi:hypothetical protein
MYIIQVLLIYRLAMTATDKWMEKLIRKNQKKAAKRADSSNDNPFDELNRWFKMKRLDRTACPNPIAWWGVSTFVISKSSVLNFWASINTSILYSD